MRRETPYQPMGPLNDGRLQVNGLRKATMHFLTPQKLATVELAVPYVGASRCCPYVLEYRRAEDCGCIGAAGLLFCTAGIGVVVSSASPG
jgi:hypothetical protein